MASWRNMRARSRHSETRRRLEGTQRGPYLLIWRKASAPTLTNRFVLSQRVAVPRRDHFPEMGATHVRVSLIEDEERVPRQGMPKEY